MIGWLKGTLLEKRPPWLLLDVGGLGYEVEAPMTVFYGLADVGAEVSLYTHLVVREDAQLLYGFLSRQEREMFRALIRVNGIGPKMALAILSGIETERLVESIRSQDTRALVRVPGVGKKTAERLVIEMRDRLERLGLGSVDTSLAAADGVTNDAVAALEALGYRGRDAEQAVRQIAEPGLTSEELIRRALRALAR